MPDLDPVVRARFFLDTIRNKPDTMTVYIAVPALRDLANTVIDLTAKVEAMEALADHLDSTADYEASQGETWDAECIRSESRSIRTALNGGDA